jgi:hypothetical protein
MADLAKQRDDISGAVETTGAAGVYAMTPKATATNQTTGLMVRVQINHDSPSGGCTFNYGAKGAKAIKVIDSAGERDPNANELKQNAFCTMTYDADANSSAGAWIATDIVTAALDTSNFALKVEAEGTKASAATCDIGSVTEYRVNVTGTTTITSFGSVANSRKLVRFTAALTLTHNATSLILPGGANITTAAGDVAEFASDGSGNWRCTSYEKASGRALISDSLLDEDDFSSDSNTQAATQQSTKAYVDGKLGAAAILEFQQSSGTNGGSATTSTWTTTPINTEVSDPENFVSLSSNEFTPDRDCVCFWGQVFFATSYTKTRIYNVTDATAVNDGLSCYFVTNNASGIPVSGVALLTGGKTYRLEYYVAANPGTTALGLAASQGTEKYATVTLRGLS